ncbi:MAG: leucine-rich repeat domain-containing protein [Eubacteriales bacterium]|nr:leucine-rich repeat domain-containing protein [Eubacteriales bacterium]
MVYKNTFHEKKIHEKKTYEKVAERIANVHVALRENHLYQKDSKLQKCRNVGVLMMFLLLWNVGYISFIDTSVYAEQIIPEEASSEQITPEKAASEQTPPETIREIGNAAFCGCTYLQGLEFPESLEKIGHRAFYKRWSSALMDYMGEDEIVKIGSHITFIGKGAFMEYSNLAFEVSKDNPKYSSEDGLLLNKEGDTILAFPKKRKGTYTIPEGIICLEDDSFPYHGEITELTLSDSLETVKDVSLPSELKKLTIGASLQEIPEFFVKDRTEVIISEENPYLN